PHVPSTSQCLILSLHDALPILLSSKLLLTILQKTGFSACGTILITMKKLRPGPAKLVGEYKDGHLCGVKRLPVGTHKLSTTSPKRLKFVISCDGRRRVLSRPSKRLTISRLLPLLHHSILSSNQKQCGTISLTLSQLKDRPCLMVLRATDQV